MDQRELFAGLANIPPFETKFTDPSIAYTTNMEVLQVNVGLLCNLACKHCHIEAGPHRTEVMTRETMEAVLRAFRSHGFHTLDITGGAPEMNPNFRWFVEEACKLSNHVIVRTNLVILLEEGYEDLPEFYRDHKIEVVCSLPHYRQKTTDRQRGPKVYERSIEALKRLNAVGYGKDPDLTLNMVFNPAGAFFPPDQTAMELEYKAALSKDHGIVFNNLFTITNNPIGRFGDFLVRSGNFEGYMQRLYDAFNPATLEGMMCRTQVSVRWDGALYDCDFNQAIDLKLKGPATIAAFADAPYDPRPICFDKHCYACTAGAGSSCGGTTE